MNPSAEEVEKVLKRYGCASASEESQETVERAVRSGFGLTAGIESGA
jgi:hypothetical protein